MDYMTIQKPTEPSEKLPSAFQLGASVWLPGAVTGVQFTEGKVHYLVTLAGGEEVSVDSVSVCPFGGTDQPPADNDHVAPGCEKFS